MEKESLIKRSLTWSFKRAMTEEKEYKPIERNMFALGMLGQNLIYVIVGSYLSVFYTDVIQVPALALLIVTIVSRVWDAINDLMMGTLVDRTHSRWGKCRPYLKYAPIPIAIFTILMFAPVKAFDAAWKVIFIIVTWLTWEALYTLGDIPLWGMTSLMTDNTEKRTKLVSLARIIGGVSVVITFLFEPIVNFFGSIDMGFFPGAQEKLGYTYFSLQQGYFFAVLILSLIGMVLFKLPFIFTRERVKPPKTDENITFKTSIKLFFSNKYYVRVMLSQILGSLKGLTMSIATYLVMWVFANGGDYTLWYILILGPFLLGNLASMATANFFEHKIGKVKTMKLVSFLGAVPYFIMFISFMLFKTSTLSLVIIMICQVATGIASGFPSVYFTTMIADSIDYVEYETGKRYDGVYLSGLNFISKFNNAITLAVTYICYMIVNYTPRIAVIQETLGSNPNFNFMESNPDLAFILILLFTIIPGVSCILQGIPLVNYKLDEKMHNDIVEKLIKNRKEAK